MISFHKFLMCFFSKAIDSFRSALRFDISDILCWEGLADAYYQRGSFNSAMKVYQKIIELDPENEYSRLQVGVVKLVEILILCRFQNFLHTNFWWCTDITYVFRVYFCFYGITWNMPGLLTSVKRSCRSPLLLCNIFIK